MDKLLEYSFWSSQEFFVEETWEFETFLTFSLRSSNGHYIEEWKIELKFTVICNFETSILRWKKIRMDTPLGRVDRDYKNNNSFVSVNWGSRSPVSIGLIMSTATARKIDLWNL